MAMRHATTKRRDTADPSLTARQAPTLAERAAASPTDGSKASLTNTGGMPYPSASEKLSASESRRHDVSTRTRNRRVPTAVWPRPPRGRATRAVTLPVPPRPAASAVHRENPIVSRSLIAPDLKHLAGACALPAPRRPPPDERPAARPDRLRVRERAGALP